MAVCRWALASVRARVASRRCARNGALSSARLLMSPGAMTNFVLPFSITLTLTIDDILSAAPAKSPLVYIFKSIASPSATSVVSKTAQRIKLGLVEGDGDIPLNDCLCLSNLPFKFLVNHFD
jgi:hypothetical protein